MKARLRRPNELRTLHASLFVADSVTRSSQKLLLIIFEQLEAITVAVLKIQERMLEVASQDDVTALETKVDGVITHVQSVRDTLQAELDSLQQQIDNSPANIDLTGVQGVVDQLDATVTTLGDLKPSSSPPA